MTRTRGIGLALAGVLALVVVFVLVRRSPQPPDGGAPSADAPADTAGGGFRTVQLWFAAADGERLLAESREVIEQTDLRARVAALIAELDHGPESGGIPVLPTGTTALHVFLDDRGELSLDLSGDFVRGFRGGSSAEHLVIGSLLRTIGDNVPEARRVRFLCEGRALQTLGGHVPLDRAFDVQDWR